MQHVLLLLIVSLGISSLAFLGFRTPPSTLQAKYLSWAHPMIACLLVGALRVIHRPTMQRLPYLAGLLLLGNAIWLSSQRISLSLAISDSRRSLATADRIIIDSTSRGLLLPAVWQLPDEIPVFAARERPGGMRR